MDRAKKSYTETQFAVPWGHVAAKVYGSSGTRVLMAHGTLDNAGSFERLLEYLPMEFQYVCIDLPGHGLSSPFPGGLSLSFYNYVHSLILVLNSLKWDSCIYIGHSLGGQLGLFLSVMYPERITKLISLDGLFTWSTSKEELIPKLKDYFDLDSYARSSDRAYTKDEIMYALKFKRNSVLNTAAAEALFTRAVTKLGEDQYCYNRDPRLRKNVITFLTMSQHLAIVQKLSVPTLLILQNSPYKESILQYIETKDKKQLFKHLKVISAGGNHDNHNNHPESIAPYICTFLQSNFNSKL